jgi:4-amino-4-deoxy-L-arabinose transferase
MMPGIFGELVYLPLVLFFYGLYKEKLKSKSLALAVWFILPYLFFSFVATKMPGYVMISAPAVFIILSHVFWGIQERMAKFKYKKAIVLLLTLLVLLPVRYSFERVRPFMDRERNPIWAQELRTLQDKVGQTKAAVFNVKHNIEAMFYAKVSAYQCVPTVKQMEQARSRGFSIFVYDSPEVPPDMRNNPNVVILQQMK